MTTELSNKNVEDGGTILAPFLKPITELILPLDEQWGDIEELISVMLRHFGFHPDLGLNAAHVEWCVGYGGVGWYLWSNEYPDEGSSFISRKIKAPRLLRSVIEILSGLIDE